MDAARFRFHGDLVYFLAPHDRYAAITVPLTDRPAVKHPIEALGVPHTEVGAVLANRTPVTFSYRLAPNDEIDAFDIAKAATLPRVVPLRPALPLPPRFIADTHLGQLARYLRLFGFDTLYRDDYEDAELARTSAGQARVLLTRDRGLLKRKLVVFGYCVRATDPRQQIVEVLRRYALRAWVQPWRRCTRCNGLLHPVDKMRVIDRLEPKTRRYYEEFQQCSSCGQVYWQGSHFQRMEQFVCEVLNDV